MTIIIARAPVVIMIAMSAIKFYSCTVLRFFFLLWYSCYSCWYTWVALALFPRHRSWQHYLAEAILGPSLSSSKAFAACRCDAVMWTSTAISLSATFQFANCSLSPLLSAQKKQKFYFALPLALCCSELTSNARGGSRLDKAIRMGCLLLAKFSSSTGASLVFPDFISSLRRLFYWNSGWTVFTFLLLQFFTGPVNFYLLLSFFS